jgi:hypothetical protein
MAKRNDIEVEDVTGTSQYDGMQVLKDAHSLPGHYIRTKESLTVVQPYFDTFNVEYDANNNPTEICYFAGTSAHLTTIGVVDDVNASLRDTYFIISTGRKEARYAIYYVVDGIGTAPSIAGVTSLPVNIQINDPASIVAFATEQVLLTISNGFKVKRTQAVLEASTVRLGVTNNTIDGGTGFIISNTAGTNEQVEKVNLTYSSSGHPIWQSQELVNYRYNVYTGRFELDNDIQVNLDSIISKDPVVYNVDMATAGNEYSLTLPIGTKRFSMKIRDNKAKYTISWISGGDTYSVSRGTEYTEEGLKLEAGSDTVYFTASKDNMVMEILTWK